MQAGKFFRPQVPFNVFASDPASPARPASPSTQVGQSPA